MAEGHPPVTKDSPVGPEFRQAFPDWAAIDRFLAEKDVPGVFRPRVKRQLVIWDAAMAAGAHIVPESDLVSAHGKLIVPDGRLVMTGVTTTAMREHKDRPAGMDVASGGLSKVYACTREGSDGDQFIPDVGDGREYGDKIVRGAQAAQGPGLGGLVTREVVSYDVEDNGHTIVDMRVTPTGTVAADPWHFELDYKAPSSLANITEKPEHGFRPAAHGYLPLDFPGIRESRWLVPPAEFTLGDMTVLAAGPRRAGHDRLNGPWFRPKDTFTLSAELASAAELDGDRLHHAIETNHNLHGAPPLDLAEYDVYGRLGQRIDGRDGMEAWTAGIKAFREREPYLEVHPPAEEMLAAHVRFVRGLAAAGPGAKYHDGAWHRADGTRVPPPEIPLARESVTLRTHTAAAGVGHAVDGVGRSGAPQHPAPAARPGPAAEAAPRDRLSRTDGVGRGPDGPAEGHRRGP